MVRENMWLSKKINLFLVNGTQIVLGLKKKKKNIANKFPTLYVLFI